MFCEACGRVLRSVAGRCTCAVGLGLMIAEPIVAELPVVANVRLAGESTPLRPSAGVVLYHNKNDHGPEEDRVPDPAGVRPVAVTATTASGVLSTAVTRSF